MGNPHLAFVLPSPRVEQFLASHKPKRDDWPRPPLAAVVFSFGSIPHPSDEHGGLDATRLDIRMSRAPFSISLTSYFHHRQDVRRRLFPLPLSLRQFLWEKWAGEPLSFFVVTRGTDGRDRRAVVPLHLFYLFSVGTCIEELVSFSSVEEEAIFFDGLLKAPLGRPTNPKDLLIFIMLEFRFLLHLVKRWLRNEHLIVVYVRFGWHSGHNHWRSSFWRFYTV